MYKKENGVLLKKREGLYSDDDYEILRRFNKTETGYDREKSLCILFEEQVKKTPELDALVFEGEKLTYGELNIKANRLAEKLVKSGIRPGSIAAIMIKSSLEMIIGILGILKAGGAYLPISPDYPEERIKTVMEDSKAKILLTQSCYLEKWSSVYETLNIEDSSLYDGSGENPVNVNKPEDLAYVMYTSGSTGKPKGVMIEHKKVVNMVAGISKTILEKYPPRLKVALVYSYIFDMSVMDIFCTLLLGHTLFIIPEEDKKFGRRMEDYFVKYSIDIVGCTPTHINMLLKTWSHHDKSMSIKHFSVAGEILHYNVVRDFLECFKGKKPSIMNLYGPTECTVCSTYYHVDLLSLEDKRFIPIGKPLPNHRIYILDEELNVLPPGRQGEIYIGGDGVGRGYLNRPDLTAERFLADPFVSGGIMYRTGDLAKWMPDGNIEFIGRIDNQVKIRGFRIELGEIESKLLDFKLGDVPSSTGLFIKNAVVLDREDEKGNKYLCAYFVANEEVNTAQLKKCLSDVLPDYMIPSCYIQVEELPMTFSGKVDRKALINITNKSKNIERGTVK